MSFLDDYRRRDDRWAAHQLAESLRWTFREACIGAGVSVAVDGAIAGTSVRTPEVTHVDLGPPVRMTVRMLPGQLPEHLRRVSRLIAPHLGGVALRVVDRGHGWGTVTVLTADPLAGTVPLPGPVRSALEPLSLGRGEDGDPVAVRLGSAAHLIVQGASGSGKSVGCYGLLGQLAHATDVRVTGSDITGLLLAPWLGRPGEVPPPVLGTRAPAAHVTMLERLTRTMDERIATMPPGRDSVDLGPDVPLILAVLEEYPGLLRVLKGADKALETRARTAVGRLLAEGRKAGVRVLIIAQRADADVIGGYERGQASHTVSFRVDTMAALKMLHADVSPDAAVEHATAPAGVALLSAPGIPLSRLRAPLTTYADYCATVAAGGELAA